MQKKRKKKLVIPERAISIFQAKFTGLLEDCCAGGKKKPAKEYNLSLQFMAPYLWGCGSTGNIKISFLPDVELGGVSQTDT